MRIELEEERNLTMRIKFKLSVRKFAISLSLTLLDYHEIHLLKETGNHDMESRYKISRAEIISIISKPLPNSQREALWEFDTSLNVAID